MSGGAVRLRAGSVPYLNAAPLTWGLEEEIIFCPPSTLAMKLRGGEIDAALVSITEVLFNDGYDVLDGIAVASRGEVKSVFLAYRRPIEQTPVIYCDPASLTSVNLLRVLLAGKGLFPELLPLPEEFPRELPDCFLLIGDQALRFLRQPRSHAIWDLGSAWFELHRLPFVYAVWALRRDAPTTALRERLRAARDAGLANTESIVAKYSEFEPDFVREYLHRHLRYQLGPEEKLGLIKFAESLAVLDIGRVYSPHYVA